MDNGQPVPPEQPVAPKEHTARGNVETFLAVLGGVGCFVAVLVGLNPIAQIILGTVAACVAGGAAVSYFRSARATRRSRQ